VVRPEPPVGQQLGQAARAAVQVEERVPREQLRVLEVDGSASLAASRRVLAQERVEVTVRARGRVQG